MAIDQQSADELQRIETSEQPDASQGGFTSEFREQARQRRFESARDVVVEPRARKRRAPRAAAGPTPLVIERGPVEDPIQIAGSAYTRAQRAPAPAVGDTRLSDDPYSVVVELSRLADRVVESREQAAAERTRADRAERDLRFVNERLMAARALVHEAQRTARTAAERCAYLEGRCEAMQGALDQALHASMIRRWRWRRAFAK